MCVWDRDVLIRSPIKDVRSVRAKRWVSLNQYSATIPYLDRAPGRLPCGQEEYHPQEEALKEMGSDIRREKGAGATQRSLPNKGQD